METEQKGLTTAAKVAIGAGLAAVVAVGAGVAVWQPWNQADEPDPNPVVDQQQDPVTAPDPAEKGPSVRVNGTDVPCIQYDGSGWSVYVPEEWEVPPGGGQDAAFASGDGAAGMTVDFRQKDGGEFVVLSTLNETDKQMQFYSGSSGAVLAGSAPKSQWSRYEKLYSELAKTLTVGTEKPFANSYIIPREPDWQEAEGMTVLFQGKDGVILDDIASSAVEAFMRSWPQEDRSLYTAQYRINGIDWAASYTGLSDEYIDVFVVRAQYRVAADKLEEVQAREGVTVVDGWATLPDRVHLIFSGDDGKAQTVIAPVTEDWGEFAAQIQ